MKTTGIFTVHTYEIPFKKYGQTIYLIPFGDVHRSSDMCDERKWHEFLRWAKKKPNCYFLGMGDYDDLMSTRERGIIDHSDIHETTKSTLEKLYEKFTDRLHKEISFMRGRLIGLVEGNHFSRFQDGATTTERLCYHMGCKYLGVTSFIVLRFRKQDKAQHTHTIVIWVHHGKGAGRTTGSSINTVEQMEKCADANIYLMGHDHKKSVALLNKWYLKHYSHHNTSVSIKKVLLARTGGFLRGYVDKKSSYIADAGMNPTDIGVVKIELTPKRERYCSEGTWYDDAYIDIHASV